MTEAGGGNGGRKDPSGASSAQAGSPDDNDPDDDDDPPDGQDEDDPADEDNVDVHTRDRTRPREADAISISSFPAGAQWRAWRANTIQSVISATGRQNDLACPWIMKRESDELSQLTWPGKGWVSLDRKLAAALTKIAHGEIGRELSQMTTQSLNKNEIVRGEVLLAIVVRYYAHGNNGQVLYDMNHLHSLKMKDSNLKSFHNSWSLAMSELEFVPDPATWQFGYYQQVKDFKPMTEDLAHYRRSQWSKSPDHSYDWLWVA